MRHHAAIAVSLLAGITAAPAAPAQTAKAYVESAVEAFGEFDYARAADLLRRALARAPEQLDDGDRSNAYSYLAAAELFRGRRDSAAAVFERLLLHDVRYRPNPLTFPPEVTNLFHDVRRQLKVVRTETPASVELQAGEEHWPIRLYATSLHDIDVTIRAADGGAVRPIYRGVIDDSLVLEWDGLDDAQRPVDAGAYRLVARSRGGDEELLREVQIPLRVRVVSPDTTPYPEPPADSLLLPERRSVGPMFEAVLGGLGAASIVILAPRWLATEHGAGDVRIGVAGALALAGIVGTVTQLPGQRLDEHVRHNRQLHAAWQAEVERIRRVNHVRRTRPQLVITTGTPVTVSGSR